MSARPFQIGDRVRITGWTSDGPHEGTVTEIEPADPGGRFGLYLVTDKLYMNDNGKPAIACCALNDEGTAGRGCRVELLEPAPADVVEPEPIQRPASAISDPGELPRRYDCPCGFGIIDGSDDVEGFTNEIYEHEEACDGMPVAGPEEDEDDEWGLGARALMLRPFQQGDDVEIDGEPGVIDELRDVIPHDGVPGVYLLASMTGFPFPAWDAVRLTPDRTRAADGRRIEWIDSAPARSRFAPPADVEPYDGGRIPDITTCDTGIPAPAAWSQAGLMSLVA